MDRKIALEDIKVPSGYQIDVFARNLTTPTNLIITNTGDMLIADSGVTDGDGKVLIFEDDQFEVLASGFNPPITGINVYKDDIYVSHKGFVTTIAPDGTMTNIISAFPSWGDLHNNQVIFGPDDKMYFGVVGKGSIPASGSIARSNPDGSDLERIAWGLRNPFRLKFDHQDRLFCINDGDEFQFIMPGIWYGWPDFGAGLPITHPTFKPERMPGPPKPFVSFPNDATIMGFDFYLGDAYVADFGATKVSKITMNTGQLSDFASNKTGLPATATKGGGLERPVDIIFDPSGTMYLVDFGISSPGKAGKFIPGTGVIWKIYPE